MASSQSFLPHKASVGAKPTNIVPEKEDFGFDAPLSPSESLDLEADPDPANPHEKEDFGFDEPMLEADLSDMDDEMSGEDDKTGMFYHNSLLTHH